MLLMGVDIGTTSAKAIVFDTNGTVVGSGFKEYGIRYSMGDRAEQDAEEIWNITKLVISSACIEHGRDVGALSLSVQGDAIIPISKSRKAVALAQLGMDYRGREEALQCEKLIGGWELYKTTGMRPHPLNSFVKMLWIMHNDQSLYKKTYKFVTYSDFLLAKLGSDEVVIDYSMASRTMCMDARNLKWSDSILSMFNFDIKKLSWPVASGTVVGTVSTKVAAELGLSTTCKIVAGGHDQPCAALGAGVIKPNIALDSHGSAEVVSTVFVDSKLNDRNMFAGYYPCYRHVMPEMYFSFALLHAAGVIYKWFIEEFCGVDALLAKTREERLYAYIDSNLPPKPSSVMVVPYLNGSGTPTCDLDAKGSILGLTLSTTRMDIAKAILESLCFEVRHNIETMNLSGINIDVLRCVGGGARSDISLQLKADILSREIETLRNREAACLGAAILAGYATGVYNTLEEAVSVVVRKEKVYTPNFQMASAYEEKYQRYITYAKSASHMY